jgi:trans-aconitate methyltransferase
MKWNADLYDDKHAFVFQYGENVLELLDVKPGERMLDLGCGTGYLTHQIKLLGGLVTGADASPEMIEKARETYPDVDFTVADGAGFRFNEPFDAVFSNAVLHWIKDADATIRNVYNNLKPGGRFVAEMGGKGNMRHMIAATTAVLKKHGYPADVENTPWYFPSTAEYATKLEAAGFRVTFTAHFDRPTLLQDGRQGVGKWLSMFGSSFFKAIPGDQLSEIVSEITDLLEPAYAHNGQWYADYKRLRFIAVKEI